MANAVPTSPVENVLEKREGHCGDSTFDNATSGGSPLAADCLQLAGNVAGDGNWVSQDSSSYNETYDFVDCGFAGDSTEAPYHCDIQDLCIRCQYCRRF